MPEITVSKAYVLECEGWFDPQSGGFRTAGFKTLDSAEVVGRPLAHPERFVVEKREDANPFGSMITIGRAPNNDIVLPAPSISKFHAFLREEAGSLFLVDANSSNGTYLNGVQLEPHAAALLSPQDEIRLGDLQLRVLQQEGDS